MGEVQSLLAYYFEVIIEHPLTKSLITGILIIFENMFGAFGEPLQILILLMLFDLITGIASAITLEQKLKHRQEEYESTVSIVTSRTMRNGIWKFIEYMLAIFIANVITVQFGLNSVREFAILWLSVTELKSIHENFYEMGFDIPLTDELFGFIDKHMKKKKDKLGDDK